MDIGVVTGRLKLSRIVPELAEQTVLLVQTQQKELAAVALVESKIGDRVLLSEDPTRLRTCFVDAAVVAVVETANLG